jgi:hypothetical protein
MDAERLLEQADGLADVALASPKMNRAHKSRRRSAWRASEGRIQHDAICKYEGRKFYPCIDLCG